MIKELIEFAVKQLVAYPDEVVVSETKQDNKHFFEINIRNEDRGKVIGRHGLTIKSLRNLVDLVANGKKILIDIAKS